MVAVVVIVIVVMVVAGVVAATAAAATSAALFLIPTPTLGFLTIRGRKTGSISTPRPSVYHNAFLMIVQNHISVDAEAVLNLMVFQMFLWSALVRLISCVVLLFLSLIHI